MLCYFLDQFFLYFFREEFGQEMKHYGRVFWNLLVQNLKEKKLKYISYFFIFSNRSAKNMQLATKYVYFRIDYFHLFYGKYGKLENQMMSPFVQLWPCLPVSPVSARRMCPLLCILVQKTRFPSSQQCGTPNQTGPYLSISPERKEHKTCLHFGKTGQKLCFDICLKRGKQKHWLCYEIR